MQNLHLDDRAAKLRVVAKPPGKSPFKHFIPVGGVILSEQVLNKGSLDSTCIVKLEVSVSKSKHQQMTRQVPEVPTAALVNLDKNGLIKVGSTVNYGDLLVGIATTKGFISLTAEEKLLRAVFREEKTDQTNDSFLYSLREPGTIVKVSRAFKRSGPRGVLQVTVHVKIKRQLRVGDVLQHNDNSFTVVRILPQNEMPRFDNKPTDCVVHHQSSLNPVLHRSGHFYYHGHRRVSTGGQIRFQKATQLLEQKFTARGGQESYSMITYQPLVGELGENPFPGQTVSRDMAEALLRNGFGDNLREIFSVKSDSIEGRGNAYEALVKGQIPQLDVPISFNTWLIFSFTRALGMAIDLIDSSGRVIHPLDLGRYDELSPVIASLRLRPATKADLQSCGEVKSGKLLDYKTSQPVPGGLLCQRIFGTTTDFECACGKLKRKKHRGRVCQKCGVQITSSAVRSYRFGHIRLARPVVRHWCVPLLPAFLGLPEDQVLDLIYGLKKDLYIVTRLDANFIAANWGAITQAVQDVKRWQQVESLTGKGGDEQVGLVLLPSLQQNQQLTLDQAIALSKVKAITSALVGLELPFTVETGAEAVKTLLQRKGLNPEHYILEVLPVLPPVLRSVTFLDNGAIASHDLNWLYQRVVNRTERMRKLFSLKAPLVIATSESRMLQRAVDSLFDNTGRFGERILHSDSGNPLKGVIVFWQQAIAALTQKRTEFAACGVVVPDNAVDRFQIGLPALMARTLFLPMVFKALLDKNESTLPTVRAAKNFALAEPDNDAVRSATGQAVAERKLLVRTVTNKFAVLQPVVVNGEAILVHPATSNALRLRCNGEKLAVYVPLSPDAQAELSAPSPQEVTTILADLTPEQLWSTALSDAPISLSLFDKALLGIN